MTQLHGGQKGYKWTTASQSQCLHMSEEWDVFVPGSAVPQGVHTGGVSTSAWGSTRLWWWVMNTLLMSCLQKAQSRSSRVRSRLKGERGSLSPCLYLCVVLNPMCMYLNLWHWDHHKYNEEREVIQTNVPGLGWVCVCISSNRLSAAEAVKSGIL